jgi:predicted lysophospholipase L1 biosynthesis ABC-type transport system permease subunit
MILMFQLLSTEKDWAQLHRQGLGFGDILRLQALTYGGLCLLGSLLGTCLSFVMAWVLAKEAFQTFPRYDWASPTWVLGVTWAFSGFCLFALSRWSYRRTRILTRTMN